MADFPKFDVQGKVWEKLHNTPLTARIERGLNSPDFLLQKSLRGIQAQRYMTQAWKPYTFTKEETPAIKELREIQEKKMNREAAAINTFYKALEEGDYATARNMVSEYSALGRIYSDKMGAKKFLGSQQTSMQAILGRGVASEAQSTDWRKEYAEAAKNGLYSVTKMLNQHEAIYLALYGCVVTAMLQQILDITNTEITVAQYERLMSGAFNVSGAFSATRKRRDAQGNYVRDEKGNIVRDRVAFSRDLFSESYAMNKEGAAVFGGDIDINVTRDVLANFFLESLKTLGVDTSGIQYVKGQNLNDYLQDYNVYASARSFKRGHDYGVYIPQGSVFNNLSDYYANNPEFFKDPLNWKSQNLEKADIQGFFISK